MLVEEPEGVVPLYIGKAETIGNFLLRLARLGGYQNRTRDTPPGNMVLWRGMARLTDSISANTCPKMWVIESFIERIK